MCLLNQDVSIEWRDDDRHDEPVTCTIDYDQADAKLVCIHKTFGINSRRLGITVESGRLVATLQ